MGSLVTPRNSNIVPTSLMHAAFSLMLNVYVEGAMIIRSEVFTQFLKSSSNISQQPLEVQDVIAEFHVLI